MLLAIDIGNTNITVGMFQGDELKATWRLATGVHRMPDEYAVILLNLLRHEGVDVADVAKGAHAPAAGAAQHLGRAVAAVGDRQFDEFKAAFF